MEDYTDAVQRHFDDAKLLHEHMPARLANASHLYGIAAECSIKQIMRGCSSNGKVPKGSNGHIPDLLREFGNHSAAKGNATLLRRVKKCATGLMKWSIHQRYENQKDFLAEIVGAEADSARKLLALSKQHTRGIV